MAIKSYYMRVSNDIYELPMSYPMSAAELARLCGVSVRYIKWRTSPSACSRTCNRKWYKRTGMNFVRVRLDMDVI